MRNPRSEKDTRDVAWLNLVVIGYALAGTLLIMMDMVQPLLWYVRGGPLMGADQVRTLTTALAAVVSPASWALFLLPAALAVVVLIMRAALHPTALIMLALVLLLLPLLRFDAQDVFAPVADLRIAYAPQDDADAAVWMLSRRGNTLFADGRGGMSLANVSEAMIEPVERIVLDAPPAARWECTGTADGGAITLSAGRKTVVIEGCALDRLSKAHIDGLAPMEGFSIFTLLALMDSYIEEPAMP